MRRIQYSALIISIIVICHLQAQVDETKLSYIRIGSLQSQFSAYGSERAWNNVYYEGLRWPADYSYQDNSVIKRAWIACEDFTDDQDYHWDHYADYFTLGYTGIGLFPMKLQQTAKFLPPVIYVDGMDLSSIYLTDIDSVDANQIPDRIIRNVVNTSMGLTMERTIYAFSQQYHDNYFIKVFTFTNTGNTDWDSEIELHNTLHGVRVGWGTRYSGGREAGWTIGDGQSWGKHTWVTRRGEDYAQHATDVLTESNPIVDWIRCGFAWAGQTSRNSFDNLGGPDLAGNGRLSSPHHVGSAILHVDVSPTDHSDDVNEPVFNGWHAGDTYPGLGNLQATDELNMSKVYSMLSGNPYLGKGGDERFDEVYGQSNPDPFTVHNDEGGTNVMMTYGPWDLAPGESVTIVEAEGINGLNRRTCEIIGKRWKRAYENSSDNGPFTLPDGSTTTDKDVYKDTWFYTGKDSILLTFSRAKRNYDAGFNIPQPPQPPTIFDVESGGDRIYLTWNPSPSESEPDFAGYQIYRAVGKPDTTFNLLTEVGKDVHEYEDRTPVRGFSYYYYILSVNDGSNNVDGVTNPTGRLHSSRFYTKTTSPAYLKRKQGNSFDDFRIVPNPYNITSAKIQYPDNPDRIMFLNIPGQCDIRIYTERGDLIKLIHHTDGSGDEAWNSISSSRQVVVSGIYIVHIEVTKNIIDDNTGTTLFRKGDSVTRKFSIIR